MGFRMPKVMSGSRLRMMPARFRALSAPLRGVGKRCYGGA